MSDVPEISDELIKEIATHIILGQTEDVEFLTVWEITEDRLGNEDFVSSVYDVEPVVRRVDEMISKAEVTVTFKD